MGGHDAGALPTLPGYPSLTAVVLDLVAKGLQPDQIGERIDREKSFVVATINMAAKRKSARPMPAPAKVAVTDFFHPRYLDKLAVPAEARGLTVEQLVKSVVRTVAEKGLVDAIMDDEISRRRGSPVAADITLPERLAIKKGLV